MKVRAIAAISISGLCLAALAQTPRESAGTWKTLLTGKTDGWETHWASDWKVADGALSCDASERSWLSTTITFADYELRLQFKGTAKVNSGVFLRSEKEGQPHITGYELQIWDYQDR